MSSPKMQSAVGSPRSAMGSPKNSPRHFPILSYVMSRFPSMKRPNLPDMDIEQASPTAAIQPEPFFEITERMPHLTDPELLASMRAAVADVAQTRSVIKALGERPDHETVDNAKAQLAKIDSDFYNQLDEIPLSDDVEQDKRRKETEKDRHLYKAAINLDEMHESYGKMLREAEKKLERLYEAARAGGKSVALIEESNYSHGYPVVSEEVKEEIIEILQDALAYGVEKIDLSSRRLPFLPEAFGKLRTIVSLNLSSNQLEAIPNSVAGLENLEELNLSSNLLDSLPDSIGFAAKLKILNVSSNKLTRLPDNICNCRSLVEINASFNKLTFLPTKIGCLVNLKRLSIPLNKIRNLPTSVGEMTSLQFLDVHFNELKGLPLSIGRLSSLEVLNLSGNFSDLTELPHTIGDLTSLRELDVSNNQLHELPITFGRLEKLTKLNVDQNPLVIPPKYVVDQGVDSVKAFMAKRWFDILEEAEVKSRLLMQQQTQTQTVWLTRSKSWLASTIIVVAGAVTGVLIGGNQFADPYLNQPR